RWQAVTSVENVLLVLGYAKGSRAPVADLFIDSFLQRFVREGVEVALKDGDHHPGGAGLQVLVDGPQGVLASPARPEAVARVQKLRLEDRFNREFERGLHDPVLDRRDAQRPGPAGHFSDLEGFDVTVPV